MDIQGARVTPAPPFNVVVGAGPMIVVDAGEGYALPVRFTPTGSGTVTGTFEVETEDQIPPIDPSGEHQTTTANIDLQCALTGTGVSP